MRDLTLLDATAQAELVRKRELQPAELAEAAIERIERLNPTLNAVVTPMYDRALEEARGELPEGPFKGVPYVLKDLGAQVAGVRYTEGSRFLAGHVSRHDQELVLRHRRAGLVALGKTSTPEFGILPTTEPLLSGRTRNPWNLEHSSGGSSGGSAAAAASGMVPLAHASDGGGSIRIPASCCGLFGLKPTRMRNPTGPGLGDWAPSTRRPDNPLFPLMRAALYVPFTPLANVTGQPAMSVPLHWTESGLPVGSQFMGRYAGEATLFRLAAQLEEARPWAGHRPPLAVDALS
jgi:Asp-tRNA(Asn)/Glu-tRNA(Gln) amidotransferase A subunit family amidase